MNLLVFVVALVFLTVLGRSSYLRTVKYDSRSFIVNGKRELLIGGSIHYPRLPQKEWPTVFQMAKENGINIIQTYVFWDIHEPSPGNYYFPDDGSSENIVEFVRQASQHGLYVHLRIGPYVCAEWNFGGFPVWLKMANGGNITFRTMDDVYLEPMKNFVDKVISVVTSKNLLISQGGPIVMLQIENEYGNMESNYGDLGAQYVQWCATLALNYKETSNVDVPWIMCQQGEGTGTPPPASIINTCNGYYCDRWIASHAADFPDQPHMFTELWPGWFQHWGDPIPHRPAVDVAFSVFCWFARGGSYLNYYMAFGGTTFGRHVGGPLIVTSYDYDVQINEYLMKNEPKFSLLQMLHGALYSHQTLLLEGVSSSGHFDGSPQCEYVIYEKDDSCIIFLINSKLSGDCVMWSDTKVPAWSGYLLEGRTSHACRSGDSSKLHPLFHSRDSVSDVPPSNSFSYEWLSTVPMSSDYCESIPSSGVQQVISQSPLEQLSVTHDATDYLWYSVNLTTNFISQACIQNKTISVGMESHFSCELTVPLGAGGGGLLYTFVDNHLVSSNIADYKDFLGSNIDNNKEFFSDEELSSRGGALAVVARRLRLALERKQSLQPPNSNKDPIKQKIKFSLPASLPSSGITLHLLSVSMGLQNYGSFLEQIQVGIVGDVLLGEQVIPFPFLHSIGLQGESQRDNQAKTTHCAGRPQWYSGKFVVPAIVDPLVSHLAIDPFPSFHKGQIFVNGHQLGRFWNLEAPSSTLNCKDAVQCTSSSYVGPYEFVRCRTGCGVYSQRYYKLPIEWLNSRFVLPFFLSF